MTCRRRIALALTGLAVAATACGGGANSLSGPSPVRGGPAVTYVALGEQLPASENDPRVAWQAQFENTALPYWATTYVINLSYGWEDNPGTIVRELAALKPTVVTVEAGFEEAYSGDALAGFSSSLAELLASLRRLHIGTILVSDLPPAPSGSYGSPTPADVAAYDTAVAADSRTAGDVFVDIHGALSRAAAAGQSVVARGDALTPAGESVIAAAFASAVKGHRLSAPGQARSHVT